MVSLEQIEIDQHNLSVIFYFNTLSFPVCSVTLPKVITRQITFSLGQCKFIWNISKPSYLNTGNFYSTNLFAVITSNNHDITDFLNRLICFIVKLE
jgi:hypothetical protein